MDEKTNEQRIANLEETIVAYGDAIRDLRKQVAVLGKQLEPPALLETIEKAQKRYR